MARQDLGIAHEFSLASVHHRHGNVQAAATTLGMILKRTPHVPHRQARQVILPQTCRVNE
jgi:thioredoxin-like negative regulator of GroEL